MKYYNKSRKTQLFKIVYWFIKNKTVGSNVMWSNYKKKIDLLTINGLLKSSVNIKKNKFEKNIDKILINSKIKYFLWKINLITNISLYLYKNLIEMLSYNLTTNKNKNTQNFIIKGIQHNNN